MASVREREGRFYVRVRRDGWKSVAKTFTLKRDAIAWGRKVEADMEAGRWQAPGSEVPTLAEALQAYRKGPAIALKGSATYTYWFNELEASSLGAKRLTLITPFDLSAWRDSLAAAGLKPGTIVRKLGLLSGLLTWCHKERGWLTCNPMRSVSKPRVSDARDRTLTAQELAALQAAATTSKAAWIGDALVVLVRSAMRRGELWGLAVADIDFGQSIAHLADTKNGSARDVPLDPMAQEALRRLATAALARAKATAESAAQGEALKVTTDAKSPQLIPVSDPHAVSLAFRRTLARARTKYLRDCTASGIAVDPGFLADVHLHDMRHTAVTRVAQTGGLSLIELAAVSGHRSLKMVQRYAHIDASKLAGKLAQLEEGATA